MNTKNTVRILIVDDHALVRSGLGAVFQASDDMELVAEASDGDEAIKLCASHKPDVVLMDLLMPRMDGVTATKIIHEKWPDIRVIALTSYKEKEYVEGVLKAGATGYLLKNVSADELIAAINRAVAGQVSLCPEAAQILIQHVNEPAQPQYEISEREREILSNMVEGKSNNEIAKRLFISQSTVKFHVSNILSKLEVSSRTEAVALALKNHLVK